MGTIYLARHGESRYNRERRFGGDSSLTALGRTHAEIQSKMLQDIHLDGIVMTEYKRSQQTADAHRKKHPGSEVFIEPSLNEIAVGSFDGHKEILCKIFNMPAFLYVLLEPYHARMDGGENYLETTHRVMPTFLEYHNEDKDYLFVAHSGTNRCILRKAAGLPKSAINTIKVPHDVIYIIHPDMSVSHLMDGKEHPGLLLKP